MEVITAQRPANRHYGLEFMFRVRTVSPGIFFYSMFTIDVSHILCRDVPNSTFYYSVE